MFTQIAWNYIKICQIVDVIFKQDRMILKYN